MSVYELGNGLRLVDLTKVLDPATESRRCHLIRYNTGAVSYTHLTLPTIA